MVAVLAAVWPSPWPVMPAEFLGECAIWPVQLFLFVAKKDLWHTEGFVLAYKRTCGLERFVAYERICGLLVDVDKYLWVKEQMHAPL